jgi:hypothetical protein
MLNATERKRENDVEYWELKKLVLSVETIVDLWFLSCKPILLFFPWFSYRVQICTPSGHNYKQNCIFFRLIE